MAVGRDKILEIFRTSVPDNVAEISDFDKPLLDSGLDSLDFANFLLGLEESFDLKISNAEMEGLVSMNDIFAFVDERSA